MLLTISTTYQPATDLGYLLHKHPERVQTFELSFGRAIVFYPEASPERATAALLLDVDPVGLTRRSGSGDDQPRQPYVNDRPYVASSFMSVALARVFGSALAGRSGERPELPQVALPLEVTLAVVPCRAGEELLRRLFVPLGYQVETRRHPLDERLPEWGDSDYYTLTLRSVRPLSELLTHLYILIPVLDDDKHYWVGSDEVEKLLRHGADWLASHPERELIIRRYLRHRRSLTRAALARLLKAEEVEPEVDEQMESGKEAAVEVPLSLHQQRLRAALGALKQSGARTVLDLGCGEGRLLEMLRAEPQFERIVGMDVSSRRLDLAERHLRLDRLRQGQPDVELIQGSLTYRDRRLAGFDAAAVIEVIEHLDPMRLAAFERVLFEFAAPGTVVLTTPNVEYNVRFPTLPAGRLRHPDHRFEWTRAEFADWAERTAARFGYAVSLAPVGPVDPEVGAPSQIAVFSCLPRGDANVETAAPSSGEVPA